MKTKKVEFDDGLHINRISGWGETEASKTQKNIFEQALQSPDESEDEITTAKSIFDEIVDETEKDQPISRQSEEKALTE
jgi:hypothetical protein